MSSGGPALSATRIWDQRIRKCVAVLERALQLLRAEKAIPASEPDLNRRLYFCLLKASRELYPEEELAPISECNNQPDADDETRTAREEKRPDFQWSFLDRYEEDPYRSAKQFVVECKRLGAAPRPSWVLNSNYANHGVARFRDPRWAYAQRFPNGAMVGYWQSMAGPDVLKEVNEECRTATIPDLVLSGVWKQSDVSRLEHTFERPFEISPFTLWHLWVDLR